ncbi:MAG: hypothetical protein IMF19_10380, partial [Proteobacteria bacterium]|nr:hypothetical protein [Pseudomonadota bacterium]
MGYDNVLKDIERREKEKRAVLTRKTREEAAIIRDNISNILPKSEEAALSVSDMQKKFPNELREKLSKNAFFLFKSGRCRQTKRYDDPLIPSINHCYYWKEEETEKEIISPIHGMYNPLEEDFSLRKDIFNELPKNRDFAVSLNDMCKSRKLPSNNSGIASSLYFLYTLNSIKREKRGRLFYYWRDADNKEYTDIRGMGRKETNQSTRNFLLDVLPAHTSPVRISVRTLIIEGGGKYSKDAIESSLQKLLKNQKVVRGWDGKRFLYRHAGPNENLKLEQIKTAPPSQPSHDISEWKEYIEKKKSGVSFPSHGPENIVHIPSSSTGELLTKYKADNKKLDERILNIEKQIADLGQKQEL